MVREMSWSFGSRAHKGQVKESCYDPIETAAGMEPYISSGIFLHKTQVLDKTLSVVPGKPQKRFSVRERETQALQLKNLNSFYSIFMVQG